MHDFHQLDTRSSGKVAIHLPFEEAAGGKLQLLHGLKPCTAINIFLLGFHQSYMDTQLECESTAQHFDGPVVQPGLNKRL
jgi:hypothetical protein